MNQINYEINPSSDYWGINADKIDWDAFAVRFNDQLNTIYPNCSEIRFEGCNENLRTSIVFDFDLDDELDETEYLSMNECYAKELKTYFDAFVEDFFYSHQ